MSTEFIFKPIYAPPTSNSQPRLESPQTTRLITALSLLQHPEGGYFVQTDKSPFHVPNPFLTNDPHSSYPAPVQTINVSTAEEKEEDKLRTSSTLIYYLLTTKSPQGHFHRNKARTMHLHHRGKARYVLLHADEWAAAGKIPGDCRIETYVVGEDVEEGEKLQWVVEGGKYKASYLIDTGKNVNVREGDDGETGAGCLISEVVVPGFEFTDHDFLTWERLVELVGEVKATELKWLVRKD